MSDCVFPLVFPDYLIAVPRPSINIDLPDFLPFDDRIEDFLDDKTTKVPDLGHAGVLFYRTEAKRLSQNIMSMVDIVQIKVKHVVDRCQIVYLLIGSLKSIR
ncbi:MAG: hypothetical protein GY799_08000 [Desulfobulbaceae bacterium]|nr:hypothetical protein [Desulfobulbaceae bacterium]